MRRHIEEKPQFVNRLDVRIDRRRVVRLAYLLSDVDANRVLFDALITGDLNLGDYRLRSLRARDGCREHRGDQHHDQRAARRQ